MNIFKLIVAYFKIKQEVKDMQSIKDGWKTTEFWGKVAIQAGVIWTAIGGFVPAKYAVIIVSISEGLYAILRTALKMRDDIKAATAVAATPAV